MIIYYLNCNYYKCGYLLAKFSISYFNISYLWLHFILLFIVIFVNFIVIYFLFNIYYQNNKQIDTINKATTTTTITYNFEDEQTQTQIINNNETQFRNCKNYLKLIIFLMSSILSIFCTIVYVISESLPTNNTLALSYFVLKFIQKFISLILSLYNNFIIQRLFQLIIFE